MPSYFYTRLWWGSSLKPSRDEITLKRGQNAKMATYEKVIVKFSQNKSLQDATQGDRGKANGLHSGSSGACFKQKMKVLEKVTKKTRFLKAMIVMGGATEPGELFQQRELEAGLCCEENCSQSPPRHPGNGTVLHSDPEFSQTHI